MLDLVMQMMNVAQKIVLTLFVDLQVSTYMNFKRIFHIILSKLDVLGEKDVKDCIPDYAGPCYEDSECCTEHCSNFICRPPSK